MLVNKCSIISLCFDQRLHKSLPNWLLQITRSYELRHFPIIPSIYLIRNLTTDSTRGFFRHCKRKFFAFCYKLRVGPLILNCEKHSAKSVSVRENVKSSVQVANWVRKLIFGSLKRDNSKTNFCFQLDTAPFSAMN